MGAANEGMRYFHLAGWVCALGLLAGCAHAPAKLPNTTRADFLKIVDRPRVPLAAESQVETNVNGLVVEHFTFAADGQQRVPGVLVKAENSTGRRPVVIVLHGTGGNKESVMPWLRELAKRGFVAVAIDGRYHGARVKAGKGTEEYDAAIVQAWHDGKEHPFFYDTVWDVMRLVDYLKTRKDVDGARIGLTGISKGGVETYLAAAMDPRIAVAAPCIGMQSFDWALENNDWQGRIGTIQPAFDEIAKEAGVEKPDSVFVEKFYDRVVPGIYSEFDGPMLMKKIAPRPLLMVNSDTDPHTPLPGVMVCVTAAQEAYGEAGVPEHFAVRIQQNTGHKVLPESEAAVMDWFVRWLRP
jgi:dienelactone hydrolase